MEANLSVGCATKLQVLEEADLGVCRTAELQVLKLEDLVRKTTCLFGEDTFSDFFQVNKLLEVVVDHGVDLHVLEEGPVETVEYAVTCGLASVCEDWAKGDQVLESVVVNGDWSASKLLKVTFEIRVSCNAS